MGRPEIEVEEQRSLTRRAIMIGGAKLALLLAIAGRLRYLQVTESEQLSGLAERNRINISMLEPLRGRVFDRSGTVLADNNLNYRILIVREQAGDVELVLRKLARIIPIIEPELSNKIQEINAQREFVPVIVAENATWKQVAAVSANAPALPGISTKFGSTRHYPFGSELAHVVGYVGPVDRTEQENVRDRDPLLHVPKFQIGKTGLEKSMDRQLRGNAGNRKIEINVQGREVRELNRVDAKPGSDLQVTIDRRLQNYASARIGAAAAAAIVMNARSGHILASVSVPTFDPNKFVSGHTVAEFEQLLKTPGSPLVNRSMRGLYPPGSTFKMVTALAALESGFVDPEEEIVCDGRHEVQNRNFHCWRRNGHGKVNLRKGLSESCDVYYYQMAERVGIERINNMANRLGFGTQHELPMPDVATGKLPTKSWKLETEGQAWLLGDTLNAGIGQGFILASALQLAVMTARIATGLQVKPRMLMSVGGVPATPAKWHPLDISSVYLNLIRDGMYAVTNDKNGTAHESRSADPSFIIAGKTGTSQVRTITEETRESGIPSYEDLPTQLRDHALFCGFAPYDDPTIVAAVIIEHGGSGSKVAAPIVRDLLMRAHYGRLPPLEAYPEKQRKRIQREQLELELDNPDPDGNPIQGVTQA